MLTSGALTRHIADEGITIADEPARDERGLNSGRAGQDDHLDSSLDRGGDQAGAGVVERGEARIARERDPLAALQARQDLADPPRFVVTVVAEESRSDSVTIEQRSGPPRVLAEHQVR